MAQPIRPPTGQRGQMMGSTMRGTTAMKQAGGARDGGPLTTNIKIAERPVTQQGMAGMKTSQQQGPGRVIKDKSFFLGLLKSKTDEVIKVVAKMKNEIEEINTKNQNFSNLEKNYENLSKEVRNLEGQLADYNLASDKVRSRTKPEDINMIFEHVRLQNDKQKQILDQLFLERKDYEDKIHSIDEEIVQIQQDAEMRLNELSPEQKHEYSKLLNENRGLLQEISVKRKEVEEMDMALVEAESKLKIDTNKLKAHQLKEQILILERQKNDLELQANEANLSFPEQKERLLAKVKQDTEVVQETKVRTKEIKKVMENLEREIREIDQELTASKSEETDIKKFEAIAQKNKDLTEFINSYNQHREKSREEIIAYQSNIVSLLESLSKNISILKQRPTAEQAQELEGELNFATSQRKNAESTLNRLKVELQQRLEDKKRIEDAEKTVPNQLNLLKEKAKKLEDEVSRFEKVSDEKIRLEKLKEELRKDKEDLVSLHSSIKDELATVNYDHNLKKQKVSNHEVYASLTELEKKMSSNYQTLWNMKNYILAKCADTDYSVQIKDLNKWVEEVNNKLIKK